jgi:hypothetical protein
MIQRVNNSDIKTTIDNSVSRRNTNRRILTPISVPLFSFLCRNVNPWLALDPQGLGASEKKQKKQKTI